MSAERKDDTYPFELHTSYVRPSPWKSGLSSTAPITWQDIEVVTNKGNLVSLGALTNEIPPIVWNETSVDTLMRKMPKIPVDLVLAFSNSKKLFFLIWFDSRIVIPPTIKTSPEVVCRLIGKNHLYPTDEASLLALSKTKCGNVLDWSSLEEIKSPPLKEKKQVPADAEKILSKRSLTLNWSPESIENLLKTIPVLEQLGFRWPEDWAIHLDEKISTGMDLRLTNDEAVAWARELITLFPGLKKAISWMSSGSHNPASIVIDFSKI